MSSPSRFAHNVIAVFATYIGFICSTGTNFKGVPTPVFMAPYLVGLGIISYLIGLGIFSKHFGWATLKERVGRWTFFYTGLLSIAIGSVIDSKLSFGGIPFSPYTADFLFITSALCFIGFLLFWRLKDFKEIYEIIVMIFITIPVEIFKIFFVEEKSSKSKAEQKMEDAEVEKHDYDYYVRLYENHIDEEQTSSKKTPDHL